MRTVNGVAIPGAWDQYNTQTNDGFELIHQPKWDTQTYTDNSTTNMPFFASAQANVGVGTDVFPLKDSYLVKAIGLFFKDSPQGDAQVSNGATWTSRFNDHVILVMNGWLEIVIGAKEYGPFPLWKLSPGAGIWGVAAAGGTNSPTSALSNYSQLGVPDPNALYTLAVPLVIPAQVKTTITARWASAQDTTGNSSMALCLEGITARPLQ